MDKPLVVYTIVVDQKGRSRWIRIGAAFRDRDGQINVVLDALPVNGTLVIREATAQEWTPSPSAVKP